ncbi:MAG TPA: MFS transporter [Chloroflexota bacterium]|nr:MFS transporter [Chloroflexota bacterium]
MAQTRQSDDLAAASGDAAVAADSSIAADSSVAAAPEPSTSRRHPSRVLLVAASVHTCNDAMFAVMYPLLPLIALDLGLSYAEVGLVKALYSGASAILQLPAGVMAERWGEYALLTFGNGWGAVGLLGMAAATTFPILLVLSILAGLGGNFQHPCASTMVARAFEGGRRGTAIGTLNFAGDLGKMAAPALVGLVALPFGWRAALLALGIFGIVFSVGVWLLKSWVNPPPPPAPEPATPPAALAAAAAPVDGQPGTSSPSSNGTASGTSPSASATAPSRRLFGVSPAFYLLSLVGLMDASTRSAALTFLPFALERQGLDGVAIGFLFGVLFVGGALGKLLCGPLGDRFGPFAIIVLTETTTALALLGLVWGPSSALIPLAMVFGFGLNGTSSVLYAAVASLVPDGKRGRGYGLYYTVIDVAAALMTAAYGLYADWSGLDITFVVMALLTLAVVPLSLPLRSRLAEAA